VSQLWRGAKAHANNRRLMQDWRRLGATGG
jgi:hypothetical protein